MRESLEKTLALGIIKDRGFADGAAVHVLDVQVSKDVQRARVLWEPMDERYESGAVERALERRKGILKQHVNSYVNQKWAIHLEFVPAESAMVPIDRSQALLAAVRADLDESARRRAADAEDDDDSVR